MEKCLKTAAAVLYRTYDEAAAGITEYMKRHGLKTAAIDGPAASGKTTLTEKICALCDGGTVHADDFFLPPALRTPERLAETGGNIDYDRFAAQIVPNIGKNFEYEIYDCSEGKLSGRRAVSGEIQIVEGSYSCHPMFGSYTDLRIFLYISPDEQRKRILSSRPKKAERFFSEWIPKENAYFEKFAIREKCDLTVTIG